MGDSVNMKKLFLSLIFAAFLLLTVKGAMAVTYSTNPNDYLMYNDTATATAVNAFQVNWTSTGYAVTAINHTCFFDDLQNLIPTNSWGRIGNVVGYYPAGDRYHQYLFTTKYNSPTWAVYIPSAWTVIPNTEHDAPYDIYITDDYSVDKNYIRFYNVTTGVLQEYYEFGDELGMDWGASYGIEFMDNNYNYSGYYCWNGTIEDRPLSTEDLTPPSCDLISQTPSVINASMGNIIYETIVNCTDETGINLTLDSSHNYMLYGRSNEGSITVGYPNRWSTFQPANNLTTYTDISPYGIMRAMGRNENQWYENNGLFSDTYSVAVDDGYYGRMTVTNDSTGLWATINFTWTASIAIPRFTYPLNYENMVDETKKEYTINKNNELLIQIINLENNLNFTNYTMCNYRNMNYSGNPNKLDEAFLCNSSYSPLTGGAIRTNANCGLLNTISTTDIDNIAEQDKNSTYSVSCYSVTDNKISGVYMTDTYYIAHISDATSGSYKYRYANESYANLNVSFASSNIAWYSSNTGTSWTQCDGGTCGTPDFFITKQVADDKHQAGVFVMDSSGNNYTNFTMINSQYDSVNYSISNPFISYYINNESTNDFNKNGDYYNTMQIVVEPAIDPDQYNVVNHTIYLYDSESDTVNYTISSFIESSVTQFVDFDTTLVPNGNYRTNVTAFSTWNNPEEIYSYMTGDNFSINNSIPSWSNAQKNATNIGYGDAVNFSVDWSDNAGMSSYIFSSNETGSWVNQTAVGFSGVFVASTTEYIFNIVKGTTIGWLVYANNTRDIWNETALQEFAMGNAAPIMISAYCDNPAYSGNQTKCYCNATDADNEAIAFNTVLYINGTAVGGEVSSNLNGVSGTPYQVVSQGFGSYFQVFVSCVANDTFSLSDTMNSTEVVLIDNTPPAASQPNLNLTSPNIRVNDGGLFQIKWNDDVALSHYFFATNDTGDWVNQTAVAFVGNTSQTAYQEYKITSVNGSVVYWKFYANDSVDNGAQSNELSFNVFDTAPTFTKLTPPDTSTVDIKTPTLTWNMEDVDGNPMTVTVEIANASTCTGDPFTDCIINTAVLDNLTTYDVPAGLVLSGQAYAWRLTVTDGESPTGDPSPFTFIDNNTVPTFTKLTPPNNEYINSQVFNLTWSMEDIDGDYMYVVVDIANSSTCTGAPFTDCIIASPTILNDTYYEIPAGLLLPDANYQWRLWVNDSILTASDPSPILFTVDTVYPAIEYSVETTGNNQNLSQGWIFVKVTTEDTNFANVSFNLYGQSSSTQTFTDATREYNFTGLAEGNYYFNVSMYDLASNYNETSEYQVTLDTTVPTSSNLQINNSSPRFNQAVNISADLADTVALSTAILETNDTGSYVNTSIKDISGTAYNVGFEYVVTAASNTIVGYRIYFNDTADNWAVTADGFYTVTNTPPTAPAISYPTEGKHINVNLTVTALCSDADVGDTCRFDLYMNDTGDFLNYGTNETVANGATGSIDINNTGLADGIYTFYITATDTMGDQTNSTWMTFVLDSQAPSWITSGINVAFNSSVFKLGDDIVMNDQVTDTNLYKATYEINDSTGVLFYENTTDDLNGTTSFTFSESLPVTANMTSGVYTLMRSGIDLESSSPPLDKYKANKNFQYDISYTDDDKGINVVKTIELLNPALKEVSLTNKNLVTTLTEVDGTEIKESLCIYTPNNGQTIRHIYTSQNTNQIKVVNERLMHFYSGKFPSKFLRFDKYIEEGFNVKFTQVSNTVVYVDTWKDAWGAEATTCSNSTLTGGLNVVTEYNTFEVDNDAPSIEYNPDTATDYEYRTDSSIVINITTIDDLNNLDTAILELDNVNQTFDTIAGAIFWSNKTGLSNANHTIRAYANDTMGNTNLTAVRTIIIDSEPPTQANLTSPTNNTVATDLSPALVWTANTDLNFVNTTIEVANSTAFASVDFSYTTTDQAISTYTFGSDLSDNNIQYWRVTVCKLTGLCTTSDINTYTTDNINPAIVIVPDTTSNAANLSQTWIFSNVSIVDTNFANVTFYLSGQSSNNQTFTDSTREYNFTGLADGTYSFNTTVYDLASNWNQTTQYQVTLDTTAPVIAYVADTTTNDANLSQTSLYANVTITEINFANVTFNLFNTTGLVKNMTFSDTTREYNFTDLVDGLYYFNVTTYDVAGNGAELATYQVNLDTVAPSFNTIISAPSITSASVLFTTNEYANATINYGMTELLGTTQTVLSTFSNTFTTTLTPLQSDLRYYYQITIRDYTGNTKQSSILNFITERDGNGDVLTVTTVSGGGGGGLTVTAMNLPEADRALLLKTLVTNATETQIASQPSTTSDPLTEAVNAIQDQGAMIKDLLSFENKTPANSLLNLGIFAIVVIVIISGIYTLFSSVGKKY
jgi:hypothetical protein